jgi:hypothetical protein
MIYWRYQGAEQAAAQAPCPQSVPPLTTPSLEGLRPLWMMRPALRCTSTLASLSRRTRSTSTRSPVNAVHERARAASWGEACTQGQCAATAAAMLPATDRGSCTGGFRARAHPRSKPSTVPARLKPHLPATAAPSAAASGCLAAALSCRAECQLPRSGPTRRRPMT